MHYGPAQSSSALVPEFNQPVPGRLQLQGHPASRQGMLHLLVQLTCTIAVQYYPLLQRTVHTVCGPARWLGMHTPSQQGRHDAATAPAAAPLPLLNNCGN